MKKKSYYILKHFFQKTDVYGQLFIFIFQLGTFLDIWVCLAKQNSEQMYLKSIYQQVYSLKQHKQIVIYRFSLQVSKNAICLWSRLQFG